jgi:hypothetical protein
MAAALKEVIGHLNHIQKTMDKLREDEAEYLDAHPPLRDSHFEMEEELLMALDKLEGLVED